MLLRITSRTVAAAANTRPVGSSQWPAPCNAPQTPPTSDPGRTSRPARRTVSRPVEPPTDIVDGGEVADSLDALIALIAEPESNLATPSHIIMGPQAWAALRSFKVGTDFNVSLVGAGVNDAELRLLGLPLIVTNALTDSYAGLVVDQTAIVRVRYPPST